MRNGKGWRGGGEASKKTEFKIICGIVCWVEFLTQFWRRESVLNVTDVRREPVPLLWSFVIIWPLDPGCLRSVATENMRLLRDGEPRTATSTFTQLLRSALSRSVSLYVHRDHTIRDGEPRTATSTFTQPMSSGPSPQQLHSLPTVSIHFRAFRPQFSGNWRF